MGRSYEDAPPKVTTEVKQPPRFIVHSSTNQVLYLFTAQGECATIPVQQLPQINDPAQGIPFNTLCSLGPNDVIVAVLSLPPDLENGYLFLTSTEAQVKRLRIEDVPGMSSNAFKVMNLVDNDRLGWVTLTTGTNEVVLVTAQGQAIRFNEDDVRPTGLPAGGMRGIKLAEQPDAVVGAFLAVENQYVWTITDDGVAKISAIDEFPTQGRAGSGVIAMRLPQDSQAVHAATIGRQDDNIVVLTSKNKAKYMRVGLAQKLKRGRNGGDYVISMREKETVAAVVTFQDQIAVPEPAE
jgi:DNA gyrase subunit A